MVITEPAATALNYSHESFGNDAKIAEMTHHQNSNVVIKENKSNSDEQGINDQSIKELTINHIIEIPEIKTPNQNSSREMETVDNDSTQNTDSKVILL